MCSTNDLIACVLMIACVLYMWSVKQANKGGWLYFQFDIVTISSHTQNELSIDDSCRESKLTQKIHARCWTMVQTTSDCFKSSCAWTNLPSAIMHLDALKTISTSRSSLGCTMEALKIVGHLWVTLISKSLHSTKLTDKPRADGWSKIRPATLL